MTELENENSVEMENHVAESVIEMEQDFPVHHVMCRVWTNHPNVANTYIYIKSPAGTLSMLADPHGDTLTSWKGWEFLTRSLHTERSKGKWTLIVKDKERNNYRIEKWKLIIYGNDTKGSSSYNVKLFDMSTESIFSGFDSMSLISVVTFISFICVTYVYGRSRRI